MTYRGFWGSFSGLFFIWRPVCVRFSRPSFFGVPPALVVSPVLPLALVPKHKKPGPTLRRNRVVTLPKNGLLVQKRAGV